MRFNPAERQQLIDRYEKGSEKLRDAFAKVPREAWNWRPGKGKWSVHEVLAHCADAEMTAATRIRFLLAQDKPLIQGYDQDEYARTLRYQARPMAPALRAFEAARATTAQLLETMTAADWRRAGTHSELGAYPAEKWLEVYAAHAHVHAAQIRRNRAAWASSRRRRGRPRTSRSA